LELARTIRETYAAGGRSWKSLAAEYGVSKFTIGEIVRNKRWPD
jgi:transposase